MSIPSKCFFHPQNRHLANNFLAATTKREIVRESKGRFSFANVLVLQQCERRPLVRPPQRGRYLPRRRTTQLDAALRTAAEIQ